MWEVVLLHHSSFSKYSIVNDFKTIENVIMINGEIIIIIFDRTLLERLVYFSTYHNP